MPCLVVLDHHQYLERSLYGRQFAAREGDAAGRRVRVGIRLGRDLDMAAYPVHELVKVGETLADDHIRLGGTVSFKKGSHRRGAGFRMKG